MIMKDGLLDTSMRGVLASMQRYVTGFLHAYIYIHIWVVVKSMSSFGSLYHIVPVYFGTASCRSSTSAR